MGLRFERWQYSSKPKYHFCPSSNSSKSEVFDTLADEKLIWVSSMISVALFVFAYLDRRRLPAVGREDACLPVDREDPLRRGKLKRPIINLVPIIFFSTYWQSSG